MKLENGSVINPLSVVIIPADDGRMKTDYPIRLVDGSFIYVNNGEAKELRQFMSDLERVVNKIANPQMYP